MTIKITLNKQCNPQIDLEKPPCKLSTFYSLVLELITDRASASKETRANAVSPRQTNPLKWHTFFSLLYLAREEMIWNQTLDGPSHALECGKDQACVLRQVV